MTEFITDRQWDGYAARINRKNLRERGWSLNKTAIAARALKYIVEIRSDQKGMIVRKGWRMAMRQEE